MIKMLTFTGADDSIDPQELIKRSQENPFLEWAILVSRNSQGGYRFPSLGWMTELRAITIDQGVNLSCHLCGDYVKEFAVGNMGFIEELFAVWPMFQRVQINTHGYIHDFDKDMNVIMRIYQEKEWIFQYDNVNKGMLELAKSSGYKVSTLFDLSHGAGILPEQWPEPLEGIKCGYAGGLGPENVEDQIYKIEPLLKGRETWIDMETKVRSNNDQLFDLAKVDEVIRIVKPYIV